MSVVFGKLKASSYKENYLERVMKQITANTLSNGHRKTLGLSRETSQK